MRNIVATSTGIQAEFALEEWRLLNQALNEILNGVDLSGEFETRIGATEEEARSLLQQMSDIYREVKSAP